MGRSLEIRSDEQYSQNADLQKLNTYISSLAYVQILTRSFAEFEKIEESLYMSIDLVLYDKDGNLLDLDHPEALTHDDAHRVNAVQFNIPIGALHGDERDQSYINLALEIAQHLSWPLYDCDRGIYLEPSSS